MKILNRTIELIVLLILLCTLIFFLVSLSPIDPITSNYGQIATSKMSAEKLEAIKAYWGVGLPWFERLINWFGNIFHLNFGQSLIYNEPVLDVILRGIRNSSIPMIISWVLGGALGYFFGVIAACYKKNKTSKLLVVINYLLISTPTYFLAIMFLFIFCIFLRVIPLNSEVGFESLILPTLTLTLFSIPTTFFHTKSKCETLINSDFVKYLEVKGEPKRDIIKNHLLKSSSLPAISIQFAQIGEIIGSSVVVENIFSYPGLGYITIKAATSSDVALLCGISVLTLVIVFAGNLASSLIVLRIDPRIKSVN